MTSHEIARTVASVIGSHSFSIAGMTMPPDGTYSQPALRALLRTQDITGLTVRVIPVPPDVEILDRDATAAIQPAVIVCVYDRLPAGANADNDAFEWHEAHANYVNAIIRDIDWSTDLGDDYGSNLVEVDVGAIPFDDADANTVFAQAIIMTFETSE